MSDQEALLAIQELLDGEEWDSETLEEIGIIMVKAGYRLRDLGE